MQLPESWCPLHTYIGQQPRACDNNNRRMPHLLVREFHGENAHLSARSFHGAQCAFASGTHADGPRALIRVQRLDGLHTTCRDAARVADESGKVRNGRTQG